MTTIGFGHFILFVIIQYPCNLTSILNLLRLHSPSAFVQYPCNLTGISNSAGAVGTPDNVQYPCKIIGISTNFAPTEQISRVQYPCNLIWFSTLKSPGRFHSARSIRYHLHRLWRVPLSKKIDLTLRRLNTPNLHNISYIGDRFTDHP